MQKLTPKIIRNIKKKKKCFFLLQHIVVFFVEYLILKRELYVKASIYLIGGHLLPHHACRVPSEALPFACQLPALLSVVVEETAQIAQLLIVVTQPLIGLFEAAQLGEH